MIKKINFLFLLLLIAFPCQTFAYSDYILAGGDNIGIRLQMKELLVIGTYEIDDESPALIAGLRVGDKILSIDKQKVSSIQEMNDYLSKSSSDTIQIGYMRDGSIKETTLTLKEGRTGLYLKDNVAGIGTLTFIDPNTKKFGALGHEIVDSTTKEIVDSLSGTIFSSSIHSITKSRDGIPGEKNATLNPADVLGIIDENTDKGIFGTYEDEILKDNLYKVAKIEDVKLGDAKIRTVIDGSEVQEYSIRITKVHETENKTKNIVFQITDSKLLAETGGIVQGMSGSPIVQGEYIVGAVTHVVVDDPERGYGILITNMLEEAEN